MVPNHHVNPNLRYKLSRNTCPFATPQLCCGGGFWLASKCYPRNIRQFRPFLSAHAELCTDPRKRDTLMPQFPAILYCGFVWHKQSKSEVASMPQTHGSRNAVGER